MTSLSKGLEVGEKLALNDCKKLTSLPKGLKVRGDLVIIRTNLTKYTDDELKKMIGSGFINGEIIRI